MTKIQFMNDIESYLYHYYNKKAMIKKKLNYLLQERELLNNNNEINSNHLQDINYRIDDYKNIIKILSTIIKKMILKKETSIYKIYCNHLEMKIEKSEILYMFEYDQGNIDTKLHLSPYQKFFVSNYDLLKFYLNSDFYNYSTLNILSNFGKYAVYLALISYYKANMDNKNDDTVLTINCLFQKLNIFEKEIKLKFIEESYTVCYGYLYNSLKLNYELKFYDEISLRNQIVFNNDEILIEYFDTISTYEASYILLNLNWNYDYLKQNLIYGKNKELFLLFLQDEQSYINHEII